jgi:hypothetical protein
MAKKLTKKQDGGTSTPSNRQKRMSNRADKAFAKASAAKNELGKQKDVYGYIPPVMKDGVEILKGYGTVGTVKVYDQPGYGKKRGQLEKTVGKNMDKVNRLSKKAASLKKKK